MPIETNLVDCAVKKGKVNGEETWLHNRMLLSRLNGVICKTAVRTEELSDESNI